MDDGRVTALTLVNIYDTFDITDHIILLRRLDDWLQVSGNTLDWFKLYQTGRCQKIKLYGCLSSLVDLLLESFKDQF